MEQEFYKIYQSKKGVKTMTKDKWINIRCTEQERQDITERAKQHKMPVAKFIFWLIEKQRKEDEKNDL